MTSGKPVAKTTQGTSLRIEGGERSKTEEKTQPLSANAGRKLRWQCCGAIDPWVVTLTGFLFVRWEACQVGK